MNKSIDHFLFMEAQVPDQEFYKNLDTTYKNYEFLSATCQIQ